MLARCIAQLGRSRGLSFTHQPTGVDFQVTEHSTGGPDLCIDFGRSGAYPSPQACVGFGTVLMAARW